MPEQVVTYSVVAEVPAAFIRIGDWIWWKTSWHEVIQAHCDGPRFFVSLRASGDLNPMPYSTIFQTEETVLHRLGDWHPVTDA